LSLVNAEGKKGMDYLAAGILNGGISSRSTYETAHTFLVQL
jgi:hypothetical protein